MRADLDAPALILLAAADAAEASHDQDRIPDAEIERAYRAARLVFPRVTLLDPLMTWADGSHRHDVDPVATDPTVVPGSVHVGQDEPSWELPTGMTSADGMDACVAWLVWHLDANGGIGMPDAMECLAEDIRDVLQVRASMEIGR